MNTKFKIERRSTKGGDKYYLVYPVSTTKRRTKISRLIKTGDAPTPAEFDTAVLQHTEEFIARAADKYAELRTEELTFQYIPPFLGKEIEKARYLHAYSVSTLPEDKREDYEDLYDAKYIAGTAGLEDISAGSGKLTRNYRLVRTCRETAGKKVTPEFIREIHSLILMELPEETGVFREDGNAELRLQMILDEYYQKTDAGYSVFEQAVLFLYRFFIVHPVPTANGLVGREIFNFLLECGGYQRIIFPSEFAKLYTMALDFGDKKDYQRMVTLFASIFMRQNVRVF